MTGEPGTPGGSNTTMNAAADPNELPPANRRRLGRASAPPLTGDDRLLVTLYYLLALNHIKSVRLMLVPWFLLLFASAYVTMANANPANFSTHPLTRTDALYFTVAVFATVGFGDITAVSQSARLVVTTQIMLDLLVLVLVLGLGVRVFVGAVQFARRQAGPGGPQARHGNRATAHNDRPNPRTTLRAWARSLPTLPCLAGHLSVLPAVVRPAWAP